ncbi:MAG: hypothetical protein ACRDI2_14105, partial [Chloroflexota bacterium]
ANAPPANTVGPAPPDRFIARYLLTFFGIGVPAAAFSAALFAWLGRVERDVGTRLAVAIGYALGSPAYVFTVSAFGHVPAGLCLFTAFATLWQGRRRASPCCTRLLLAGSLLGLAGSIEYPAGAAALVVALYGGWRAPRRLAAVAWLAAGAAPILIALAAYQWAVFGRPWDVGYAHLAPGTAYAAGQSTGLLGVGWPSLPTALALLAGLRRGLLVHAPWLALALPGAVFLWRRGAGRAEATTAAAVFAVLLAINSGYVFWDGGASWGPRHLVPSLPFLTLLAVPAARRWPALAWTLVGASVLLTLAAVATRTLPTSDVAVPLRDALAPSVLAGQVTNNWGQVAGLASWRGVVPLAGVALLAAAWLAGFGRSFGWLATGAGALWALATLHRAYLEYSEGYYLYLGARLAAGARLYADAASTQPPVLPMLIALLWGVQPDVYLPRILAVVCYVAAALLAGRLAHRLSGDERVGALATFLAALLPLGLGAMQSLDANALLAPLGPALVLLWVGKPRPLTPSPHCGEGGRRPSAVLWSLAAGIVAAVGLSVKLTFLCFALAPVAAVLGRAVLRPSAAGATDLHVRLPAYLAGFGFAGGAHLSIWLAVSGRRVIADGLLGELESPLLPTGAVLALYHLLQLEGIPVVLAAWGWWMARRSGADGVLQWSGVAAASMPLFAAHQGTFVGVARPAEPFIAAFAAVALVAAGHAIRRRWTTSSGRWRTAVMPALVALAVAQPTWQSLGSLAQRQRTTVDPDLVLSRLAAGAPDGEVLAPPYYAALARRRMLFDYADWTVWGMRAAAGAERERSLAAQAVERIEAGAMP